MHLCYREMANYSFILKSSQKLTLSNPTSGVLKNILFFVVFLSLVFGSLLNGIGRKFRARVFAPGFHFFLNTGSLPIPQVWRNKTHIIFRRRKILKWKLIFNQCNQISNRNTASLLLYKFQLSFNHNRLYFLSCCCSDSSLLTPKL